MFLQFLNAFEETTKTGKVVNNHVWFMTWTINDAFHSKAYMNAGTKNSACNSYSKALF